MIDYREVKEMLDKNDLTAMQTQSVDIAKALRDCRNELCSLCGNYLEADLSQCKKCRWRDE